MKQAQDGMKRLGGAPWVYWSLLTVLWLRLNVLHRLSPAA
jgi:hypothetical protein